MSKHNSKIPENTYTQFYSSHTRVFSMDTYTIISSACVKHKDEPVISFCNMHGVTLCRKCLLGAHANCKHTNTVEDIADAIERAESELPNAIVSLDRLTTHFKDWTEKYAAALQRVQRSEEKLTTGIKQMQDQMIEQVNKLATEALEMVSSVVGDQRSMVKRDIDRMQESTRKVTDIQCTVQPCREGKQISVEHAMSTVAAVDKLDATLTNKRLKDRNIKVLFYVSDEIQYMKKNLTSFGELCVEDINIINSDTRSRHSIISLGPCVKTDIVLDDNFDGSVFVMPVDTSSDRDSLYVRIDRPNSVNSCSSSPPPLPDMHPDAPLVDTITFEDSGFAVAQTLPRPTRSKKASHNSAEIMKSNTCINSLNTSGFLGIPPLPKKRTSLNRNDLKTSINEANAASQGPDIPDNVYDTSTNNKPRPDCGALKFQNGNCSAETGSNGHNPNKNIDKQILPEIKVHPPTMIKQIIRGFENNTKVDKNAVVPTTAKRTHGPCNDNTTVSTKPRVSTNGSARDSGIVVNASHNIPALPKSHDIPSIPKSRGFPSLPKTRAQVYNQHTLAVNKPTRTVDDIEQRHSYEESLPSKFDSTIKEPVISVSVSDLTRFYDVSGNSSESSRHSDHCRSVDQRSSGSVVSFNSDINNMDKPQQEVPCQLRPKLSSAADSRKSKTFSLFTSTNPNLGVSGRAMPPRHSTITGIAVTSSGMLFICDTENHCLQLFDTSGLRLYDYKIREPFSCCRVRDELIAVTSKERKTICIFDLSNSTITCKTETHVTIDAQVFGVDYMTGFFCVCCGDRVVILSENLQPYRIVKPMALMKKKRSEAYFVDVKYIAVDWSALGFYIYTSEHNIDRVSCIAIGRKDRLVWNYRVGKPSSIILSNGQLLVAGNGKIVVLDPASGQRVRDIRHDVPSHPVHMVVENDWLYISKSSKSNTESRNIRRIPIV